MEKKREVETREFSLPNKKVVVRPILERAHGMIKDRNHEAYFLFGESTREYGVRRDRQGRLVNPLTQEEREFFEDKKKSGMSFEPGDLSPFAKLDKFMEGRVRKPKSYWETKAAKVRLGKTDRVLDLSDPSDYLTYKILLTNSDEIAPTADEMLRKATYRYAIVEENYEINTKISKAQNMRAVYRKVDELTGSKRKMKDFLLVYGKKVSETADVEFLEAEIVKIAEEKPKEFMQIVEDSNFETKALIMKGVMAGAIRKSNNRYYLKDGNPMNLSGSTNNLDGAVEFISAKQNQDTLLNIESAIEG